MELFNDLVKSYVPLFVFVHKSQFAMVLLIKIEKMKVHTLQINQK